MATERGKAGRTAGAARRAAAIADSPLRSSPTFIQAFTMDGRPYIAQETEPYVQYWIDEYYRILLSLFSAPRGCRPSKAIDGYFRLTGAQRTPGRLARLGKAIADMRDAGVLMAMDADTSRYSAQMVRDYVAQRPFPRELSDRIIADAGLQQQSRVLDLAGGPGDLSLALARVSANVTLMELSHGFVQAAQQRAAHLGLPLATIHESCNRLVHMDEPFDLVTVSQALHWLDDVLVCRGVCRSLTPGGSFVVVHSSMDVPDDHPLAYVLGRHSILGEKIALPFADEVRALLRRLSLLFEALDAPDVHRVDVAQRWRGADGSAVDPRIRPARVSLYRQRRPIGPDYARAFLSSAHIEASGQTPEAFWRDLDARCAGLPAARFDAAFDWSVLQFTRSDKLPAIDPAQLGQPVDIGFAPNVAGW